MFALITRTQEFRKLPSGIIYSRVLPDSCFTVEDAKENISTVSTLSGGGPALLMVDISMIKEVTSECRDLFCHPDTGKFQQAVGIIATTTRANLIASFFLGFNRPKFPLGVFHEESSALAWLRAIKNEHHGT
ncbi:hypothetical protein [Echinicola vietnamensis]|uniref:DUF7793 domain-containing protein n=1 Tax=Echinicola vietnamensis (strain DSM 17526 / LMG 23754 / KMM 6221) TaxID=926556 RepID=L0G2J0_ECHVK|nr:hypothetical protein [Echinicola vietnamensis]AGA80444.1 hypothetical protein Echvi_4249 [Echinicola vietnamensis DSM 17526]